MEKISINLIIFCLLVLANHIWAAYAKADEGLNEKELFLQNLCDRKEKVAQLHFYLQDKLKGPDATVWEVARSNITSNSPTDFGLVRVIDDLITAEPDHNSKKLGRAEGLITFSDLKESALTMNINFYFAAGKYRGSTLSVLGRNPITEKNRELPIVGGTGVFRMTRGYAISNTYSYDTTTNYGVLEYTVYVFFLDKEPRPEVSVSGQ